MCLLYCACYTTCILPYPLHMSHACHRFWNCYKTFTFCSLLTRCPIFCACHVKRHLNVQKCSVPLSVICTYDLEICFAPQRRALFRHVNFQKCSETMSFNTFDFEMCFAPQWRARLWALTLLTLKCASRHNGVHFFDITTSKSAPELRCFVHFDLEMCFAPQRRVIFHLSSGQMAPHPPLYRAYFSTFRSHKSL